MFVRSWTLLSLIVLPAAVFAQQVEIPFVVSVWTEERPVPPSCSDEDTTHIKGYFESSIVKWASVFFNDGTLALDSPEMIDLAVPGLVNPNNTFTASNNKSAPDLSLNARRTQIRKKSYLYSATNTYTCRLCPPDNLDMRRNVRGRSLFVHQHFENYMSYQVTEDLRFYTKEAIRARNGELHCLGNGVEIQVKFIIDLDSLAIDLQGVTLAEPIIQSSVAPNSGEASSSPSSSPTIKPTLKPTNNPTQAPTPETTQMPILDATNEPKTASNPTSPTPPPTPKPTQPTGAPTQTPTNSPTKLPTKTPTKAPNMYPCELPLGIVNYSLITSGYATIGAQDVYKPIIVAGILKDSTPINSLPLFPAGRIASKTKGKSYIDDVDAETKSSFDNFRDGGYVNIRDIHDPGVTASNVSWRQLEWLALHAKNAEFPSGHKVIVFNRGGTFNTDDADHGGDPNDRGKTLMIFNTFDAVNLTRTDDGRAFGPSVLAPFANVELHGIAKSIDGFIVAKNFQTSGTKYLQAVLLMKGIGYNGTLTCS
jgi:hypothetical protein